MYKLCNQQIKSFDALTLIYKWINGVSIVCESFYYLGNVQVMRIRCNTSSSSLSYFMQE